MLGIRGQRKDTRYIPSMTANCSTGPGYSLSLSTISRDVGIVALQFSPYQNFLGKAVAASDHQRGLP